MYTDCNNCGENVHLSNFLSSEIVDYLEDKGYLVFEDEDEAAEYLKFNGWYCRNYSDGFYEIDTSDLIEELECRGFRVYESGEPSDLEKIVQYHRCGDPRWEKLALDYIYSACNKVV